MNYYDLSDICFRETTLKVSFSHPIEYFGGRISQTRTITPASKKVDLPLFAISFLLKNGHCKLEQSLLHDKLQNDLKANASLVNIGCVNSYFHRSIAVLGHNKFANKIFFERLSEHVVLLFREPFSEENLVKLDMDERNICVKARKHFMEYKKFFLALK